MLVVNQKIQVLVWAIFLCGIMILKKMLAEISFMVVAMETTTDLPIWRNVKPSVIQTVQSILEEVTYLTTNPFRGSSTFINHYVLFSKYHSCTKILVKKIQSIMHVKYNFSVFANK